MGTTALVLAILGAINWGFISLFHFDVVAWIGGGQTALLSRIVYGLFALAGIGCIPLLFGRRRVQSDLSD